MTNGQVLQSLDKHVRFSRASRARKLGRRPVHAANAKLLELLSAWSGRSIRIRTRTFWGAGMSVVIPERVSMRLHRYGYLEEGLTRVVAETLRPGMTFFDVGAHFGYFSLLASTLVGESGSVHAFEPTPSTYGMLTANVGALSNVRTVNCAVMATSGSIALNDYGVNYSAFNSVHQARLPKHVVDRFTPTRFEARGISIDAYVAETGAVPNFVKVDAESAEVDVIRGMEATIRRHRPVISIEVGDIGVEGVPTSRQLIEMLAQLGYQPMEFANGTFSPHVPRDGRYEYDNILFFPNA